MRGIAIAIAIGAVLLFVGILAVSRDYIEQVIHGPETITLTQLSSAEPATVYGRWFDFTAEALPRHLLQTTTRRRRGGTTITNHFALIRQTALLVETSNESLPPRFLAWASELNETSSYYQRARKQLDIWTAGRGSIPLSPVLLRIGASVNFVRSFLGLTLTLATAGTLYLLWRAIRMMRDITTVAPIARLRKSVRAKEGIPALIEAIDQKLASIDPRSRRMGVFVLPGWLISIKSNSFDPMSADDIVWIAPYTRKTKLYGVITTSKQQLVKVFDRHRRAITLQVREDEVAGMLKRLHHLAPWAIVGGDAQVVRIFGSRGLWGAMHTAKRAELIEAVDKRRREIHAIWAEHAKQRAEQN
jgi:hypothetical protein